MILIIPEELIIQTVSLIAIFFITRNLIIGIRQKYDGLAIVFSCLNPVYWFEFIDNNKGD